MRKAAVPRHDKYLLKYTRFRNFNKPVFIPARIDFITISTQGDATDFGNLTGSRFGGAGGSSRTRGVFMGGGTPSRLDNIDFVTIATAADSLDFGDLITDGRQISGDSNGHGGLG